MDDARTRRGARAAFRLLHRQRRYRKTGHRGGGLRGVAGKRAPIGRRRPGAVPMGHECRAVTTEGQAMNDKDLTRIIRDHVPTLGLELAPLLSLGRAIADAMSSASSGAGVLTDAEIDALLGPLPAPEVWSKQTDSTMRTLSLSTYSERQILDARRDAYKRAILAATQRAEPVAQSGV